ncbi:DNA internalization-related competence protein ComEC/Rec2 [Paraliobacillus quinghaiensis]|uniref:DNA internalization-related competence protein ComEC/Rec2 n=1 Tax=Paraliobacillus quinghaiensis TaxID=470815 RepID=A0A917WUZ1_9BACI|nr:DNA internalization-related competence protein ComEC/Rec2 [Paraliobacillus quinghaiensis]GGM31104.1 DNA internalization-related competence protein ComEC/Rec2 [Paraliobacillus quinghaiensis]
MRGDWNLIVISVIIGVVAVTLNFLFIYAIFAIWLYLLYQYKRIKFPHLILMIIACFISSLYYYPINIQDNMSLKQNSVIEGVILSEVEETTTSTSFIFQEKKSEQKLSVTYFKDPKYHSDQTTSWKTGATCSLQGQVVSPPISKNPGQFNYRKHLKKQAINYQLTLGSVTDLECENSSVRQYFYNLRKDIKTDIETKISSFSSAWIQALLLGQDNLIEDADIELFQRWNLSHLLAISGLHVGLISGFIYFIFTKTGMLTREKAYFVLIVLLLIYPFLSGGSPSVWRAVLMSVLGIIVLSNNHKIGLTDIISIVFLLCLIINKEIIFQLGFQFSFIVTLAILLSRKFLMRSNKKLEIIFRISFISTVSVLPLQLAHFYFINPLAILLNLFIVPYFTLIVMPLLFVLFISSYVTPFISTLIDTSFELIHQFVLTLIRGIDDIFYYPWVIGEIPFGYFIPYYSFLIFLFIALNKNKKSNIIFPGILLVGLMIWIACRPYLNPYGTVTMLDVGQGDAIVIELPYRKGVVLIDAAGTMQNDFTTPSDRTYKQIIKPFLYSKGIGKIDAVILSHADHDHIGSVSYLIKEFAVQNIITSPYFIPPEPLSQILEEEKQTITAIVAGQQVTIDNQAFKIIHPDSNHYSKNDNSLVILSNIGGLTWLFTGDISKEVEINLTHLYPNLTVDVLKVAHHGSNSSSVKDFLNKVKPDISLISVGENNRYNHPHKEVMDRLLKKSNIIYRTDLQGAIQYTFKDNGEQGTFSTFLP